VLVLEEPSVNPREELLDLLARVAYEARTVVLRSGRTSDYYLDCRRVTLDALGARLSGGLRLQAEDLRDFMAQISHEKTVQQVMTQPVCTVRADESLGHAVQKMLERGLRRLPVVDAGRRLVGMISRLDALRAVGNGGEHPEQQTILQSGQTLAEVMHPQMPAVHVNDDLVDVLQQMLGAGSNYVVVLDEREQAIGIITDGDMVARVSPVMRRNVLQAIAARVTGTDVRRGAATAREIMSEQVLSAPGQMTVLEGISLMLREGRKRIVIVDEQGRAIGIVDRQTLMMASLGYA
jgi:CBS-domain-containing membrane protein